MMTSSLNARRSPNSAGGHHADVESVAAATATTEAKNQEDDVPLEGSMYDRYPLLNRGEQMLDRIHDRLAGGYFREQTGDALKVAKTRDVPTEVPAGLDPSYHFYDLDGSH
ncbi:hypothetical protein OROMI_006461 [Orobanche minor]